jgi:RNA polymerase sigma-70 factor (ECF subfamily)
MEAEAYQRVVLELKDRVFGYSSQLLRDREEARDVTQEAFIRLWEHRAALTDPAAAKPWVLRTAHNLCIDRLRQRRSRGTASLDDVVEPAADPSFAPDRPADDRARRAEVERALGRIPPRDRALLLLREVHGHSYEELANLMDTPIGTLKSLLHRARARLRREVERLRAER